MKTIADILSLTAHYLEEKGIERSKREAEELVADQLGCKRIDLFLDFEKILTAEELERCRAALKERATHTPLPYIKGSLEFFGVNLIVTPDVLIPRPETERLVELVIASNPSGKVLDLCCGSGAIGLALKKALPTLDVTLADISPEALLIAQKNAQKNDLDVTLVQSDLLSELKEEFDVIVCNPPYIAEHEYAGLSEEVKKEPKLALVSGDFGYECYEKLAQIAQSPAIFLEIGTGMGKRVASFFEEKGYKSVLTHDYAGHERYLSLRR